MATLLEMAGAGPNKQPKYAPIFMDRAFTGIFTQRSVLHDPSDIYTSKYYGGRPDALWAGKNIELTNRLTLQRRPGLVALSVTSPFNYPTQPLRAYSFQLTNGTIRVMIDTQATPSLVLTGAALSTANFTLTQVAVSGTTTVYTGTITGGGINNFVGVTFIITGFGIAGNNTTFTVTANTTTTLTGVTSSQSDETHAGTATCSSTTYTGTVTGGASNAYVGLKFLVAGFQTGANNGTFVCTASSLTTLILTNAGGASETHAATAVSSGAVYWDHLDGTTTMIYAKTAGAGQSYFIGSGGILYVGDGVDTWKWTPLNSNINPKSSTVQSVWNWGIVTPLQQPTVTSVASGAAAPKWQANTIYSSMGLTVDSAGLVWQLIDVNADGTNTANAIYGTAGNGNPVWNQALNGTTTDSGVTWTNYGQIEPWQAGKIYADSGYPSPAAETAIYDPTTSAIYLNHAYNGALVKSGHIKPNFNGIAGTFTPDHSFDGAYHSPNWYCLGTYAQLHGWQASHVYGTWLTGYATEQGNAVIEPFILPPPSSPVPPATTVQPIYLQVPSTGGTSGASYTPFQVGAVAGDSSNIDGQLQWLCLGSATWQPLTPYVPWEIQGSYFGCVQANGSMHVCVSGSRSGTPNPPTFGAGYGDKSTLDGDITWVNVGPQVTWVAGSATTGIWNLPLSGFQPPTSFQKYGGSVIDSSSGLVEGVVSSGKTGATAPTWSTIGLNTPDPNIPLAITAVTVSGASTTYAGTITGGGTSAVTGHVFLVTGCGTVGNNGFILVTSSTAGTMVCTTTSQVTEASTPAAAAAVTGLVWYAESLTTTNSLVWTKGYAYAYSYKARAYDDFYSPLPLGGGYVPPGSTFGPLGLPLGSATEAVSTASPAFVIVGGNVGAVNVVTGFYSPDPQVDTIIIWRSADGGGPYQMFELTEIPNNPTSTVPWSFSDFLPDIADGVYPGLNYLIPAPINNVNDPPLLTFLPQVYNFERIWGTDGQYVDFSGGPDTLVGNPDEAFSPSDGLPFLAPVTRVVKSAQGLITYLTDSVQVIAGGPATATFFSVEWAAGIGLLSYNFLDVFAGEQYFFSSDNQFRVMTPSLNITNAGFALGDQFANQPNGTADATWDPAHGYVASHQSGTDNAIFVADNSTGWYRLNPRQAGAMPNTEPVWSPFAAITNGCRMVQSVEVSPGIKKLLVGSNLQNEPLLERSQTVYSDNGTSYDAYFEMGNIALCHPGQLALLKFVEFDFNGVKLQPTVSYLLNEISGTFVPFTAAPVFDPPSLYGDTIAPTSYSPNRYYFTSNASLARCRHLRLKVDFGSTSTSGDELLTATIFGRLMVEV